MSFEMCRLWIQEKDFVICEKYMRSVENGFAVARAAEGQTVRVKKIFDPPAALLPRLQTRFVMISQHFFTNHKKSFS